MRRLFLVRHADTAATRAAAFPADESIDERGRAGAAELALALPAGCDGLCSPSLRCRQTADAAGIRARTDAVLAECDFGRWSGRSLADIHERDPEGARDWMLDPDAAPHGGESLATFARRVALWLDREIVADGALAAITHGGVVKAAAVHALGAPLLAFWRIEVAPLSITELHGRDGVWTVARVNCPVGAAR